MSSTATDVIQVAIADDVSTQRRGVRSLIDDTEGLAVVADAADVHAVQTWRLDDIDVVLADLYLDGTPSGSTPSWTYIRDLIDAGARVLLFTSSEHPDDVIEAVCTLGIAFQPKLTTDADLVNAIRLVADGRHHDATHPVFWEIALSGQQRADQVRRTLTDRQYDVVERVIEGLRNAEIAREMGIREDGVRQHLRDARDRLEAEFTLPHREPRELIAEVASAQGWVDPRSGEIVRSIRRLFRST